MDLKSMTMEELTDCIVELGEKKFRAKQIYGWLHQKLVRRPDEHLKYSDYRADGMYHCFFFRLLHKSRVNKVFFQSIEYSVQ